MARFLYTDRLPASPSPFCAMKTALSILIALLAVWRCAAGAEPNGELNGDVVRRASEVLLEQHLRQDVDQQELSRTWARQFLLTLDPRRMHFLESDVDEFIKRSPQLLADAQEGQVGFALLVAKRFRTRLAANSALICDLLSAAHDFTIEESMPLKYETYVATKADCDHRWHLRIKHELLMENANDPGAKSSREFLRGRYARLRRHFKSLSQSKVLSLYIDSLARSFDPESAYFDEDYLSMYRTSQIPNYTLGLEFAYHDGDLWIQPTAHDDANGKQSLAGCRIVAVRQVGRKPIHLSGHPFEASKTWFVLGEWSGWCWPGLARRRGIDCLG